MRLIRRGRGGKFGVGEGGWRVKGGMKCNGRLTFTALEDRSSPGHVGYFVNFGK